MLRLIGSLMILFFLCSVSTASEEKNPVFSGPQVGEKLPSFTVQGVFDDLDGKDFDFIKQAKEKPVALIFVHSRTRPAFGLTNKMMKFAATKSKSGLQCGVIFLTSDLTSTKKWMTVVRKHFPKDVTYGLSKDGQEGPGAYGLNRNVTLTILIGNKGKVTSNFAIVQPSLQGDGPKILKAIVDVTGGGDVPKINELGGQGRMERKPRQDNDPKLTSLLRAVINKQATTEDVEQGAVAVEKYVEKNEKAQKILGRLTTTIVNSGKLTIYGTEPAQKVLQRWQKKYSKVERNKKDHQSKSN